MAGLNLEEMIAFLHDLIVFSEGFELSGSAWIEIVPIKYGFFTVFCEVPGPCNF